VAVIPNNAIGLAQMNDFSPFFETRRLSKTLFLADPLVTCQVFLLLFPRVTRLWLANPMTATLWGNHVHVRRHGRRVSASKSPSSYEQLIKTIGVHSH